MPSEVEGKRVDGDEAFWANVAVYWKWSDGKWMIRPPCGHHLLIGGEASKHYVEEFYDGRISVEGHPAGDPENSNSILCPECGWHGFIERGVWMEI